MSVTEDTFVSRQLWEKLALLTGFTLLAPYIPPTDSSLEFDTSNFDKTFLTMDTNLKRDSVLLNGQDASRNAVPTFDDSTFAVYEYAERESDYDNEETPSPEFQSPSTSGVSRRASLPLSDDDASDSGSDTLSTSVSSLDIEDGLGVPAMQGIPEELEDGDLSTETATAHHTSEILPAKRLDKAVGQEHTSIILQRIQALTSEPGIKFSSRHSREARRASVEHGRKESGDDWTILELDPKAKLQMAEAQVVKVCLPKESLTSIAWPFAKGGGRRFVKRQAGARRPRHSSLAKRPATETGMTPRSLLLGS